MDKEVISKRYGKFTCILDDKGREIFETFGNGSGKWNITKNRDKFYLQKRTSKGLVYLHRLIVQAPPGKYVDHINENTLDNRQVNLRVCTNSANLRNGRLRANNTSGVKGVTWNARDKKWSATIKVKYRSIFLGNFTDFEQAVEARKSAEKLYWHI